MGPAEALRADGTGSGAAVAPNGPSVAAAPTRRLTATAAAPDAARKARLCMLPPLPPILLRNHISGCEMSRMSGFAPMSLAPCMTAVGPRGARRSVNGNAFVASNRGRQPSGASRPTAGIRERQLQRGEMNATTLTGNHSSTLFWRHDMHSDTCTPAIRRIPGQ